ncbi:PREDICTED: uncharacterized protein C9orf43 homolog [Condylura cristata]|uniref:uncharacterized protein C9orf43 homolog n=1 Tax=Condylura cristata TaxID=143302 RepID=UPI0006433052|nr:PREDICTED: uncharacterized protein C9orf43 homolog [Condylura cristata]
MDLPSESEWDETTCNMAICQHPQCWATIRRIERGHPRIRGAPCKTLESEDKLPVLTIVNISDPCLQAKRRTGHRHHRHHLSGLAFTKARSLLSRGSKFPSKFQGRPQKDLPDRSLISRADRSLKLPVLNLNRTQIPCPQDVRNMVVIWIPEESDDQMIPTERKHIVPKQFGKKDRKKSAQYSKMDWGTPRMMVPPPSPVHLFEQLTSHSSPPWNKFDMLPQDLLKDLLSDKERTISCPELEAQLAMVKKTLPLEKSRPDSAISAKMSLSIQRLTLQRPMLRYPGHLKKFSSNPKTEDHWKQQKQQKQPQQPLPPQQQQQHQQMKAKRPTKKKEAKKKSKSDPGSQDALHKHSVLGESSEASKGTLEMVQEGHGTLLQWEGDKKQQEQKIKEPTLKAGSTERLRKNYTEICLNPFPDEESPELPDTEPMKRGSSAQMEFVLEVQKKTPVDLSSYTKTTSWNPELKLLRILQGSDEGEENQTSEEESEGTLRIQAKGVTEGQAEGLKEGQAKGVTEGQAEVLMEGQTEGLKERQLI